MATSILGTLKFTTAKKPTQLSPVQNRRNKLCKKLEEQIAIAQGLQTGIPYVANKITSFINEKGEEEITEVAKRLKYWWFALENGKLALTVRYGARTLVLNSKNATAIEVADLDELVAVLGKLKAAVDAGELDTAIETASSKLRAGFAH
jgi:hypothetical protein